MQSLLIVVLSILAAVVYGIVHDQITARICVEYFTIGHPPVFDTADPTLLGLGWGIIATWWMGLFLGVLLAVVARAGTRPKRSALSLIRPLGILLAVMALSAITAGCCGWYLAAAGSVHLVPPLAQKVPSECHARFLADLWAHNASYLVGFCGAFVALGHLWHERGKHADRLRNPPTRAAPTA